MTGPSRLRFAPSPTGFLHVGGARTALFNWLYARHTGGTYLLRIEDTDTERNREEWVDGLQTSLRWLGLDWDEPAMRQSSRMDLYAAAGDRLFDEGKAYYCDCTADQVQARNKEAGGKPGYDGFCRERGLGPGEGRALRFRTPDEGTTVFEDLIRERVSFENSNLEDFVLLRSNRTPTFLLANAIDDVDQEITHVVRGEEHVNGTPKYLLIRDALGHTGRPVFAHLPVIVNEKRQKLSKRRDDVAVESYRSKGYLAESLRNYLATLGWGPPDGVEIRPVDEIVDLFDLRDVTKSSAYFDTKKLDHFNGEYLRELSAPSFVQRALPWLETDTPWPPERFDLATFERLAPLVQERVRTLAEVPGMVDFVFLEEPAVDQASWDKVMVKDAATAVAMLDATIDAFERSPWDTASLHGALEAIAAEQGLKLGKAQAPVRVAVTGRTVGPPLFESLEVLGREVTLDRLRRARSQLG